MIRRDLREDPRDLVLAASAYGLSFGGLLLLGGRLADPSVLGTVLSGAVTTWVSWRRPFAGSVVVAALGVAAARRLPGTGADRSGRRLDAPGALLATAGLAVLLYGLGSSVWAVLAGLVLLALFGVVERCSPDPLAPLPFLRARALTAPLALLRRRTR